MEPKSERMSVPQWDGDPSGWRDYQQEVRLIKTGENLEVNWSVAHDEQRPQQVHQPGQIAQT